MPIDLGSLESALVEFALAEQEWPTLVGPCRALAAVDGVEGKGAELLPGAWPDSGDDGSGHLAVAASRGREIALQLFDRLPSVVDGGGFTCLVELTIPTIAGVMALSPGAREDRCSAYTVGFEVSYRVADAIRISTPPGVWSSIGTGSGIGAVLAASRSARLSTAETGTALALLATQSACIDVDRSQVLRRFRAADTTALVIEALLAAQEGIEGSVSALSGQRGLFAVMSAPGASALVASSLGQQLLVRSVFEDGWSCPWDDCGCAAWQSQAQE